MTAPQVKKEQLGAIISSLANKEGQLGGIILAIGALRDGKDFLPPNLFDAGYSLQQAIINLQTARDQLLNELKEGEQDV